MFVVTGLHTKRRPPTIINKTQSTAKKKCVKKPTVISARSRQYRQFGTTNPSSPSSGQAAHRVSEPKMIRNDGEGKHPPFKVPVWRLAPPRVRNFVPKPLILVERMKARRRLIESSTPVASAPFVAPKPSDLPVSPACLPLSVHMTPRKHQTPARTIPPSDLHLFDSVSVRISSQNDVVDRGLGMKLCSAGPLSVITLADSSSSTDTFVADSPCRIKQDISKVPVLVKAIDATNIRRNVRSDPTRNRASRTDILISGNSVATNSGHQGFQLTDPFEPFLTSTPLISSESDGKNVPSSALLPICTTRPLEQAPGSSDRFEDMSPTSLVAYPVSALNGDYTVKLPIARPTVSLLKKTGSASCSSSVMSCSKPSNSGDPLVPLINAPKPTFDFPQLSRRAISPSPTLVLDGVFALPKDSPPSSTALTKTTLNAFSRPRKPASRRPLSDITNVFSITPPSDPSTSRTTLRGNSHPESPRSKLARVLITNINVSKQTTTRTARMPPLVEGVGVSNDPKTQCEIKGLKAPRAVGLGRFSENHLDADGGERGAIERVPLGGVGMVAKLRARWETGAAEHRGRAW